MKLREAIEKSVKSYYNGKLPEESIAQSGKDFRWTLEFFDNYKHDEDADEADEPTEV